MVGPISSIRAMLDRYTRHWDALSVLFMGAIPGGVSPVAFFLRCDTPPFAFAALSCSFYRYDRCMEEG